MRWLVYVEAMNLIAWHYAGEVSRTHPNLAVVPPLLVDTSVAELAGPPIEKFGISLRVPWKDMARDRTSKTVAMMSFQEGGGMLISDGAKIGSRGIYTGRICQLLGLKRCPIFRRWKNSLI
jgi:hypothetical protein